MPASAITLLGLEPRDFRRLAADPGDYAAAAGVEIGPDADLIRAVAANSAAFLEARRIEDPWGSYLAIDPASRRVVGTCSFKGPPDADGGVEIAYFTFPDNEGRGIGTAMARALVEIASRHESVSRLVAHTLPARNASVRILERLGFSHTADIVDPDDGPVWRWERKPAAPPAER